MSSNSWCINICILKRCYFAHNFTRHWLECRATTRTDSAFRTDGRRETTDTLRKVTLASNTARGIVITTNRARQEYHHCQKYIPMYNDSTNTVCIHVIPRSAHLIRKEAGLSPFQQPAVDERRRPSIHIHTHSLDMPATD